MKTCCNIFDWHCHEQIYIIHMEDTKETCRRKWNGYVSGIFDMNRRKKCRIYIYIYIYIFFINLGCQEDTSIWYARYVRYVSEIRQICFTCEGHLRLRQVQDMNGPGLLFGVQPLPSDPSTVETSMSRKRSRRNRSWATQTDPRLMHFKYIGCTFDIHIKALYESIGVKSFKIWVSQYAPLVLCIWCNESGFGPLRERFQREAVRKRSRCKTQKNITYTKKGTKKDRKHSQHSCVASACFNMFQRQWIRVD